MRVSNRFSIAAAAGFFALSLGACGDGEAAEAEAAAEPADEVMVTGTDRFLTLDANGDSYLDADEIAEWVDDEGILMSWDIDADSEIDEDDIEGNAFRLWDQNDDGLVSEEEWKTGAELWYPTDTEIVPIADWDLDGDSELDADEFAEAFDVSVLGEIWVQDDLNRATFKHAYFDLYDTNDDGLVDRMEWDAGLAFHGIPNPS
ncbi:MAG: hypothetical protein R3266_01190 [Gemmatimonadota bacterium]|nr:hypothetical protein [Gemmatimonadota bacterium]